MLNHLLRVPLIWQLFIALPVVFGFFNSSKPFYLTAELPGVSDRQGNPAGELKFFTCPDKIAGETALCIFISGEQGASPTQAHLSPAGISATIIEANNPSNKTSSCSLSTFGANENFYGQESAGDLVTYAYWQCGVHSKVPADHQADIAADGAVTPKPGRHWELCPYSMSGDAALYRSLSAPFLQYYAAECSHSLKVFARNIPDRPSTAHSVWLKDMN